MSRAQCGYCLRFIDSPYDDFLHAETGCPGRPYDGGSNVIDPGHFTQERFEERVIEEDLPSVPPSTRYSIFAVLGSDAEIVAYTVLDTATQKTVAVGADLIDAEDQAAKLNEDATCNCYQCRHLALAD